MTEIVKTGFDYRTIESKDSRNVLKQQATAIKAAIRRSQNDIIEIGNRLIDAKEEVEHGQFMSWIQDEFSMSQATAQRFMQVSKQFGKFINLTNLDIQHSALYALSAPSIPEEAREEAIEIATTGETVTHAKAKEIVAKHTPPKPELNQPSGHANRNTQPMPDIDDTDPHEHILTDGYGRPAQKFVEETHEVINPHLPDETPEVVNTLKDLTQAEEDALSPEEWLAMLPLFDKLVLEKINSRLFCEAALNWRNMRKSYLTLRREVKANVNGAAPDAYSVRMRAAVSISHPKDWTFSRGAAGGFIL